MMTPQVRDWDPVVLDVAIVDSTIEVVLSLREDMEVRSFKRPSDCPDAILDEIQDVLDSNKNNLPLDFSIRGFMVYVRNRIIALHHLVIGDWLPVVMEALDEKVAGEEDLKKVLLYSGMSAGLKGKLHTYIMGDSQKGKSFVEKNVGTVLFPDRFIFLSTMSAKACFGRGAEDPEAFKGRILCIDELKDLSPDTRATIKAMASNETEELIQHTIDDSKKFKEKRLVGMPVIWTNTMESFEDKGNQIANRFFKPAIDGSQAQDDRVEVFQKDMMKFGRRSCGSGKAAIASAIIVEIMRETNFCLLNPYADYLKVQPSVRNRFPMYTALLTAITYSNRHRRLGVTEEESRTKYLFATLSDNRQATQLYTSFAETQDTSVPPRLIEVMRATSDTEAMYHEDIAEKVKANRADGTEISADTCYNYLRELAEKNLVSAERMVIPESRVSGEKRGRAYLYKRIKDLRSIGTPHIQLLDIGLEEWDVLARYFDDLEDVYPQLYNEHDRDLLIATAMTG